MTHGEKVAEPCVSIGGRENYDKEQFNGTGTDVGLRIYKWVG